MPKKYLKLLFLLFLLIILALFLTVTKRSDNSKSTPNVFSDKSFTSYSNFAKENGPEKAYELLKQNFPQNNPEAHDFAHVIGISAYEQLGPQGLAVCDTAYNYGCYHGFIEAFLVKKGTVAIAEIEKSCQDLGPVHAPSCLHGIGHGVLAGRAYKLNEALTDCGIMAEKTRIYCWDGVFMERVSGSMQNTKDRITITKDNLRKPCDQIAEVYKSQCWRNQVTAWFIYFKNSTKDVGTMCFSIEKTYQNTCFESIGLRNVMSASDNQLQLIELCRIGENGNLSDDCLIGELKELLFEGKSAGVAQNLCTFVSLSTKQQCLILFNQLYQEFQLRFGS